MVRVLFIGPVLDLEAKISKLTKLINKSGPFDLIMLLSPAKQVPKVKFPLPTYFAADEYDDDSNPREIAPNLFYSGSATYMNLHGLKIFMCSTHASALAIHAALNTAKHEKFDGADILITNAAPRGAQTDSNECAARLGLSVRPRYHCFGAKEFCSFPTFVTPGAHHATRLIAVPSSGRWVYAADVTSLNDIDDEMRCANATGPVLYIPLKRWREQGGRAPKRCREATCWFCLGNSVAQHLVVAVGQKVYVALARGGLNDVHLVIVPVIHTTGCTSSEVCETTVAEVEGCMKAVRRYYKEENNEEAFFFERCAISDGVMHMCVQAVSVKQQHVDALERACVDVAKQFGMVISVEKEGRGMREARGMGLKEVFWASLPEGKGLFVPLNDSKRLPALYGRLVACSAFGTPRKIEWRKCILDEEQEKALAERIRCELAKYIDKEVFGRNENNSRARCDRLGALKIQGSSNEEEKSEDEDAVEN